MKVIWQIKTSPSDLILNFIEVRYILASLKGRITKGDNMAKRGVLNPKYGITNAAFFGKIRSALRKEWRNSQMYKDALKAAKRPYTGGGRRKISIECAECGTHYANNDKIIVPAAKKGITKTVKAYVVHHKIEAGQLNNFSDLSSFAERLFCDSRDLAILCYFCHCAEHKKEVK